jgi:uncharacterized protein
MIELATGLSADARPASLLASRHRGTAECVFPRVPPGSPAAPKFETITLSSTATLYSFTVVHPSPKSGEAPFILAFADFPEAARVMGRLCLAPGEQPRIGMALRVHLLGGGDELHRFHFKRADDR